MKWALFWILVSNPQPMEGGGMIYPAKFPMQPVDTGLRYGKYGDCMSAKSRYSTGNPPPKGFVIDENSVASVEVEYICAAVSE